MTAVDNAIAEIGAALDVLEPQLEGLRDFARLNLESETREEINAAIVQYERREVLLLAARDNAQALVDDGYPVLDVRLIEASAYADLQANAATIEAALARFSALATAATLRITAGAPELKS